MKKSVVITVLLAAAGLAAGSAAHAQKHGHDHAHVHGTAKLEVAVEGNTLVLSFYSPLDNLVGFEHAPRTEQQKKSLQAMQAKFAAAETMFVPSPEARCTGSPAKVESPFGAALEGRSSEAKGSGAGHAGLTAQIAFKCALPLKLSGMRVDLFDAFPRVRQLDVQVVGTRKQSAARLSSRSRNIVWQ